MSDLPAYSAALRQDERGIWFAESNGPVSYPAQGHATCFAVEDSSFWFAHRNRCIVAAVRKHPPNGPIFDVGGGNGFVARALLDAGCEVVLVEPAAEGALNARARGLPQVVCATLDAAGFAPRTLPAAGLFDVIEHIEDDVAFLRRLAGLVKPGGHLYATVPAHAALWSDEDVRAGHFRRYASAEFAERVREAGFDVIFSTLFFRPLPLAIFLMRTLPYRIGLKRNATVLEDAARDHGARGGALVALLQRALKPEVRNIKRGKRSSFGASILLVGRRRQ
jgi:SAM-dependent methyltransferase